MPKMKAAKLAAISKMKSVFSKNKYRVKGDESPAEEAAEGGCGCGMPGCKDCAKK